MALTVFTALPVSARAEGEEAALTEDCFTIGIFTPLTGNFFTDMWGTGTSDVDARELLHGYPLAKYDVDAGNYVLNEDVVTGCQVTTVGHANRMYNIFIADDLKWSDGTSVTAYDYAFTILFMLHPETAKAGASRPDLSYLVGAEDYMDGKTDVLEGLRVLSDRQLLITVKKDALPYFYEYSYIAFKPYPIDVIAPNAAVKDDGNGAYLDGRFNASILKNTVLGEKGYNTKPSKVCGHYTLESYKNGEAVFARNEYYRVDDKGELPFFKKIVLTSVTNDDAVDKLSDGTVNLLHKVTKADTAKAAAELANGGNYTLSAYPRTGLSFISFCTEKLGVSEPEVRQAIAMCLDKEALTESYVSNNGMALDGFYGIGQWMYQTVTSGDYPTTDGIELAKWQKLSLDNVKQYAFDPEGAAKLLEDNEWTADSKGIREKKIDGHRVKLDLTLYVAEGNEAEQFLFNEFTEALKTAGIKLTVKVLPWEKLLKLYYRQNERSNDMFYLASNFAAAFNPAGELNPLDEAQGVGNRTGIRDEALYEAALDMARTEPKDRVGYATKWVEFVEKMAETLPVIPVYSNMYFDYYTAELENYEISAYTGWPEAFLSVSLAG